MGGVCGAEKGGQITLTLVGDDGVGKSALITKYKERKGVDTTASTIDPDSTTVDSYYGTLVMEKVEYNVVLVDTYCSPTGNEIRALSYGASNVVIIAFAIDNRKSFENVKDVWRPEVGKHTNKIPVVLCGTKTDLRTGNESNADFVTADEALELCKTIEIDCYVECSMEADVGVEEVVAKAADEARKYMHPTQLLKSQSSRMI